MRSSETVDFPTNAERTTHSEGGQRYPSYRLKVLIFVQIGRVGAWNSGQIRRKFGMGRFRAQRWSTSRRKDNTAKAMAIPLAGRVKWRMTAPYPESADAHETLAEAYLANEQKDLARQHAEKALALLDSHAAPASSWTDTEPYRGEIRHGAQDVLKKLSASKTN